MRQKTRHRSRIFWSGLRHVLGVATVRVVIDVDDEVIYVVIFRRSHRSFFDLSRCMRSMNFERGGVIHDWGRVFVISRANELRYYD